MDNACTQILYHIVFSTKDCAPVLHAERREDFFRCAWGIHLELNCPLYRINAMEDHVHVLMALHPLLSLEDYMRELKTGTTEWIGKSIAFPEFDGWQQGYAAFTVSIREKESVIRYIKNQQVIHEQTGFLDEYRRMLEDAQIKCDEPSFA